MCLPIAVGNKIVRKEKPSGEETVYYQSCGVFLGTAIKLVRHEQKP